jgi:hypothetical protein
MYRGTPCGKRFVDRPYSTKTRTRAPRLTSSENRGDTLCALWSSICRSAWAMVIPRCPASRAKPTICSRSRLANGCDSRALSPLVPKPLHRTPVFALINSPHFLPKIQRSMASTKHGILNMLIISLFKDSIYNVHFVKHNLANTVPALGNDRNSAGLSYFVRGFWIRKKSPESRWKLFRLYGSL